MSANQSRKFWRGCATPPISFRAINCFPLLPQIVARLSTAKLAELRQAYADGKSRYGVVHLPTNYQPGTKYPTVFLIYEEFFDDRYFAFFDELAQGRATAEADVEFIERALDLAAGADRTCPGRRTPAVGRPAHADGARR